MQNERTHPDLFTAEEAAIYLHLQDEEGKPNVAAIKTLRDNKMLKGWQVATRSCMYWREDLDECALHMVGRSEQAKRNQKQKQQMRIAE